MILRLRVVVRQSENEKEMQYPTLEHAEMTICRITYILKKLD